MLSVFMEIATCCNFLFDARCGAMDFFDKLRDAFRRLFFENVEKWYSKSLPPGATLLLDEIFAAKRR